MKDKRAEKIRGGRCLLLKLREREEEKRPESGALEQKKRKYFSTYCAYNREIVKGYTVIAEKLCEGLQQSLN